MDAPLFRTQTRPRAASRSATVAICALIFSMALHLGTYSAVRNRIVSFLRSFAEPAPKAVETDISPTQVHLYEGPDTPAPKDLLQSSDPLSAETQLPASLIAKSEADATFAAPPVPEAPSVPSVLPPPPAPSETPRLPPPSEMLATDILAITTARDLELALPVQRHEIPAAERHTLAPDPSLTYSAPEMLPLIDARIILSSHPMLLASVDPAESVSLPAPKTPEHILARTPVAPSAGTEDTGDIRPIAIPEIEEPPPPIPLDDRLAVHVSAFRPETDRDHIYFQLDITPRDAESLPDIPRDIVFVLDTSNSLSYKRLNPCKKAVSTALRTLKPTDRFNVCAFAEETAFLLPDAWIAPTPEAFREADAFLAPFESHGNTDLFQSMLSVLDLPRDADRAQIAILLTDGRITAGRVSRDSAVIGTFSRLNAGAISVFTVNVNAKGNAYLLDMLSFCDRGGNTATSPSSFDIGRTVQTVVGSIGQPILTNVHFVFDSVSAAQSFPKLTSNLYRDRPLRLYGRVDADTPVFAFQARGDANGDKYDMAFEIDLRDSSVAEAPDTLPVEWATQRMYDLVATYARSEDPSILAEMRQLGAAFGITVPHGERLGVPAQP